MRSIQNRHRAVPLGLAAVAALAVGLVSAGPALVAPAAAAENAGSAFIANNTLTITGTNGPDVVTLDADATEVAGHLRQTTPRTCTISISPTSTPSRCPLATATTSSPSSRASSPTSR